MSRPNDFDDIIATISVLPEMAKMGAVRVEMVNNGDTVDFITTMKDGTRDVQSGPKDFSDEEYDKYTPPIITFMNFVLDLLNEEKTDAPVPTVE